MDSKEIAILATRLLELEQRFESYFALYEEEVLEIKSSFRQIREEILNLKRNHQANSNSNDHHPILKSNRDDTNKEATDQNPHQAL